LSHDEYSLCHEFTSFGEIRHKMARRKKNDTFELLWQGLVVIPAFLGFWVGFRSTHSIVSGGIGAGIAAVSVSVFL
jgi:hypothetical protein